MTQHPTGLPILREAAREDFPRKPRNQSHKKICGKSTRVGYTISPRSRSGVCGADPSRIFGERSPTRVDYTAHPVRAVCQETLRLSGTDTGSPPSYTPRAGTVGTPAKVPTLAQGASRLHSPGPQAAVNPQAYRVSAGPQASPFCLASRASPFSDGPRAVASALCPSSDSCTWRSTSGPPSDHAAATNVRRGRTGTHRLSAAFYRP